MRRDNWTACRHGFEHNVRHPFPLGGEDEQVGCPENPRHILLSAGKDDPGIEATLPPPRLETLAFGPLSDEEQLQTKVRLQQRGKGLAERQDTFLRIESSDRHRKEIFGAESPLFPGTWRSLSKPFEIDAIWNHAELRTCNAERAETVLGNSLADANMGVRESVRRLFQPVMPAMTPLSNPVSRDNGGDTC